MQLIRLTKRREFVRLAKEGRKAVASGLILQVAKTPADAQKDDIARIGFTVSGKVGNAVVRNRVRRRLKALAAELFPLCAIPGFDYVIIGRHAALKRPFSGIAKDLKYTLHKTGTFHEEDTQPDS